MYLQASVYAACSSTSFPSDGSHESQPIGATTTAVETIQTRNSTACESKAKPSHDSLILDQPLQKHQRHRQGDGHGRKRPIGGTGHHDRDQSPPPKRDKIVLRTIRTNFQIYFPVHSVDFNIASAAVTDNPPFHEVVVSL